ncbi:MAG: class I SAM-dependent methyltransferase [Rhodothermales bacterium]
MEEPQIVLDLGCGQGRDALFIGRLGHTVTGVDLSESGIAQLLEDADTEGLNVGGVVSDLVRYLPDSMFDIVLIDRTLHMLRPEDRLLVLRRVIPFVKKGGYVLISDEPSNLPAMEQVFIDDRIGWQVTWQSKGYLFLQQDA